MLAAASVSSCDGLRTCSAIISLAIFSLQGTAFIASFPAVLIVNIYRLSSWCLLCPVVALISVRHLLILYCLAFCICIVCILCLSLSLSSSSLTAFSEVTLLHFALALHYLNMITYLKVHVQDEYIWWGEQ